MRTMHLSASARCIAVRRARRSSVCCCPNSGTELLKVARGKPEIHQIRAMMDPKNAASRRVLFKNSFVYETTEHIAEDNTDAETYSIQL